MNIPLQPRALFSLFFVSTLLLLGYALYTEHYQGLDPCPLCMTQRLFYLLTGLFALLAAIHNPAQLGIRLYASLTLLSSAAGAAIAGRQVWLQSLPEDQVPACGPSLDYMLETFPLGDVLRTMLTGDGNCAEVVWTFLGLSMPNWSLICFLGYALLSLWLIISPSRK